MFLRKIFYGKKYGMKMPISITFPAIQNTQRLARNLSTKG